MLLHVFVGLVLLAGNVVAGQKSSTASAVRKFRISGTLVDASTGTPVKHARVVLAPVTQRADVMAIMTGEDGRFLFEDLGAGKYSLTAEARGYLTQSFNQHDQFSTAIVVSPDLDSGDLMFRLPRESAISGVVTDEAGEGVRDAPVALYFTGLFAGLHATLTRGQTTTDDQGAYHFFHLPPGRYLVAVNAHPWYAQHPFARDPSAPHGGTIGAMAGEIGGQAENPLLDVAYPLTFYGGVTDPQRAAQIVLGRGEQAVADVVLQPVRAVHVRIDNDGNAFGRTGFSLERQVPGGLPMQVSSQQNGDGRRLEIAGIPPGHYTMKSYVAGKRGEPPAVETREIDVTESGTLVSYSVDNTVPVSADVRFESEAPGQASLQLLNKTTRNVYSERISDAGGVIFQQGVVAGVYEISIVNAPDVYLKSISAAGARVAGRTIEVVLGTPGRIVKLTINAARGQGEVTGVALRDNRPFAGAMIVLIPADPVHNEILVRRDQSDSDGTFTLSGVVPGSYTALAIENGWELEWMNPEALKPYLGRGVTVQVQPKGKYDIKVTVQ